MIDLLDKPCVFCGYKGAGYWSARSHATDCPWHDMPGKTMRLRLLRSEVAALAARASAKAAAPEPEPAPAAKRTRKATRDDEPGAT